MSLVLSENGLKWKYLQSFNILAKFWFSSNGLTFSQSVILKLSILILVGLVSQSKLSVSVFLFVCLSVYMFLHFSRMTQYFFWNLAYGPLRHYWGGHKHIKNSYLSPTPGLFYWVIFTHFCGVFCIPFFLEKFNIFSWNLVEMFLVLLWRSLHTKKPQHGTLCWG